MSVFIGSDYLKNSFKYSEDALNSYWSQDQLTATREGLFVDGSTASLLTEDNTSGDHRFYNSGETLEESTVYNFSAYLKSNGRRYGRLRFGTNQGFAGNLVYDLLEGVLIGGAGEMQSLSGGWFRISFDVTTQAGANLTSDCGVILRETQNDDVYTGDGVSGQFVFGVQLTKGSGVKPYQKTTQLSSNGNLIAPDFPFNHARIGYKNKVSDAAITGSSEVAGFEADSIKNQLTYEFWRPAAMPANVIIDMGSAQKFNYIGLAAHTLGDEGVTLQAEYSSDNITYNNIDSSILFEENSAFMLLFDEIEYRYVRLTFTGATVFSLGVVYVGQTLDMYRPFYSGHTPDAMGRKTTIKPTKSVAGQWVGRSIIRNGFANSYQWQNIPVDWYRVNVDPFAVSAQKYPFFMAWNISEEPEDCLYAWVSDDISPSLSGTRDLVEFGFSVEGLGDE